MAPKGKWAIAIHGGAGTISKDTDPLPYEKALTYSMGCAARVLECGRHDAPWNGSGLPSPPVALGAALAAVEAMEDCELFNAGKGGVLNDAGVVELEASVMDGSTMRTGAICGTRTVQNPARLATAVYSASRFQFLGFESAECYADHYKCLLERRPNEWFVTERRKAALQRALARGGQAELDHSGGTVSRIVPAGGTVGAAVCDGEGNVAVVTSTGGQTCKMAGRIGDTAVIGAGSYACNQTLALSGTGNGEHFLRYSAASQVSFAMRYGGASASDAISGVVHGELPEGSGGFVAVTPAGDALAMMNSAGMFRALRDWRGKNVVRIWED